MKQTSYSDSSSVMTTPTFASDLLSSLHHMYETKVCCDIVVVAGSVEISVHKVVLVAASGYLRTLLMASDSVPNNVIYLPPSEDYFFFTTFFINTHSDTLLAVVV